MNMTKNPKLYKSGLMAVLGLLTLVVQPSAASLAAGASAT